MRLKKSSAKALKWKFNFILARSNDRRSCRSIVIRFRLKSPAASVWGLLLYLSNDPAGRNNTGVFGADWPSPWRSGQSAGNQCWRLKTSLSNFIFTLHTLAIPLKNRPAHHRADFINPGYYILPGNYWATANYQFGKLLCGYPMNHPILPNGSNRWPGIPQRPTAQILKWWPLFSFQSR